MNQTFAQSSSSFSRMRRAPVGQASAHSRQFRQSLMASLFWNSGRMTVEKPLIVYKEPGVYMDEIYDIYGY